MCSVPLLTKHIFIKKTFIRPTSDPEKILIICERPVIYYIVNPKKVRLSIKLRSLLNILRDRQSTAVKILPINNPGSQRFLIQRFCLDSTPIRKRLIPNRHGCWQKLSSILRKATRNNLPIWRRI